MQDYTLFCNVLNNWVVVCYQYITVTVYGTKTLNTTVVTVYISLYYDDITQSITYYVCSLFQESRISFKFLNPSLAPTIFCHN